MSATPSHWQRVYERREPQETRDLSSRCMIRISLAPIAAVTRKPASATGTEYRFWRTQTSALPSTRTVVVSVVSNGRHHPQDRPLDGELIGDRDWAMP